MNYQDKYQKVINKYLYAGINTLLVKDGKVFSSNHGYQDLENKIEISNDTIFRIASVSKVIVALGIMKLYEEGKIDVKEDISKYLGYKVRNPHFPDVPITIEMVMTQTSSISDGNHEKLGYDGINGASVDVPLEDLLTKPESEYYLDRTFRNVMPGTHWEYSNFGCGILACIIEHVSGVYFSDYIREHILLPLNIDGSFKVSDIVKKDKVATLYGIDKDDNFFVPLRDLNSFLKAEYRRFKLGNNYRMPAGGLFISINDLSKIMQMMMNYGTYQGIKIFNKETIKFMKEIHWEGTSDDPEYKKKGLQLLILDGYTPNSLYGHFGCAYGLRSFMLFNDEIGMLFICNGADYHRNLERGITNLQHETIEFMVNYKED